MCGIVVDRALKMSGRCGIDLEAKTVEHRIAGTRSTISSYGHEGASLLRKAD